MVSIAVNVGNYTPQEYNRATDLFMGHNVWLQARAARSALL